MATAEQTTQSQVMNGADILVKALVDHGVELLFAYPGGASMPLHQALTRFKGKIRTILPRHEQGGAFAAQGYARSTGRPGVCMATSGPGATNLVTAIADAKLDSIPLVVITGQVRTNVIGTDAFQETPIVEVCRGITKHHYLVTDVHELPRVMREAFHIATTGRPGPVLVDMPKDIQEARCSPDWNAPLNLPGYEIRPRLAHPEQIKQVAAAVKLAKRPVIYAGGGVVASGGSDELRAFVKKTGIPVSMTVMGLGAFPSNDPLSLDMLGMHGSVYSNWAVRDCDLLLALGVRFDDRVTGKLEAFAKHAKIVHIDIDPSELNKNKEAHIPIVSDVKYALAELNKIVEPAEDPPWVRQCRQWKKDKPFKFDESFEGILQQSAIAELSRLTQDRQTIVTVGVGQHQMWSAQFYKFQHPRTWLSSSGLGTMGFGLPAAMGGQAAHPDALVIDIDGDGSFQMNIQELATCFCEKLPVKVLLLNNQHLGMVVQWEDRFHQGNRAHTYLGPIDHAEATGKGGSAFVAERYPDFVMIAKGYGCGAATVSKRADLTAALKEMINYPGPYVLDVEVPYQEHVLPMIPAGRTVDDMITEQGEPMTNAWSLIAPGFVALALPLSAAAADPLKPITFNDIKFEMKKEENVARSMLTPKIEGLHGKRVKVHGWIHPNVYQAKGLKRFILVRDNMECCFGPGAALYDSILVDMDEGTSANFSYFAIAVEGVLTIREHKEEGVVRCVYHLQATKAK